MKTIHKIAVGLAAWGAAALLILPAVLSGCSSSHNLDDSVVEEGFLRNDDLVAVKTSDGKITIRNESTGKVTIKDIKLDWTQESSRDSLADASSLAC